MLGKRIVFTGGSGKVGRHVIPRLLEYGHKVMNVDLAPIDIGGVPTIVANLSDAGEAYNSLTLHFGMEEYFAGDRNGSPVDAVVHFAAIPRILMRPDNAMFAANVLATYNVIEAATKLGIRKIVIASSETVYGVCFAEGVRDFPSFPVEEETDADPTDSYGLSKLVGETIARSFASRTGADIYALRIGGVVEPHEYAERFPAFLQDPSLRRRDGWTFMDARDLGQIVHRCLEIDGLGFQVFNAVNDQIVSDLPTEEFLARHAPGTPLTRPLSGQEGPLSNRKAREVLGFRDEHGWQGLAEAKDSRE